jgi:PPE family
MSTRWRGHEHSELFTMINAGPGPGASDEQNQYWSDLARELKEVDDELHKALGDMKATWEGMASDGANSSGTPLQRWAGDAQTGSSVMHISTVDQAEFISTARHEMPPPVEVTTPKPSAWQAVTAGAAMLTGDAGPAAAVAQQAADHEAQEAAKEAAAQKAVDTMTTYESNSTWNSNTLGTFVAPPDVVVEASPPTGGPAVGGPVGSAAGFGTGPGTREGSAQGSYTYTGPTGGGNYTQPSPGDGSGGGSRPPAVGGGGGGGGVPIPGNGGQTDPSWVTPGPTPPTTYPTPPPPPPGPNPGNGPTWGGGPGGGPYGLPTTGGLPGGGEPSGGTSNLSNRPGSGGPGGPRGGGLGVPGGGAFDAADGGRGAAQLGRGGTVGAGVFGEGVVGRGGAGGAGGVRGGMPGGPMGGAGAQGDEDDEHFSPDYLLETTDVFGDERMVSPAVIGADPKIDEEKM